MMVTQDLIKRMKEHSRSRPRVEINRTSEATRTSESTPESLARKVYEIKQRYQDQQVVPTDFSFSGIGEIINNINEVQHQFELLQRAEESPVYKGFLLMRDRMRQMVGKPSLYTTYNDLFGKNIETVGRLNQYSDQILLNSTREHSRLVELVNLSLDDSEKVYIAHGNAKGEVTKVLKDYEKLNSYMDDMKPGDVKDGRTFFELKKEKLGLERRLEMLTYGDVALLMDKEKNIRQIQPFYENMERLYRFAVITAKRVKENSEDLRIALKNTHHVYTNFDNVYNAAIACQQGLGTLADYHRKLNHNFATGLREMTNILHNDPNMNLLGDSIPHLIQLRNDIESLENSRMQQNENLLQYNAQ